MKLPSLILTNARLYAVGAAIALLGLAIAGCGGNGASGGNSGLNGTIKVDGSSTVGPLTESAAELFMAKNSGVRVTVGTSGTGGGFEKFCAGETDISDASRPIKTVEEVPICKKNGVEYDQLQVANDGLAVVVNPQNTFVKCLTAAQLKKIWDRGSRVHNWKDVDPSFPDLAMKLYGPGTSDGTFDYFTAAINGVEDRSRSDYNATEDDNVTVQGVSGDKGGLGYFGLSYVEQNQGKIKDVAIDGGGGCVSPTKETVQSGAYKPLSRPLFIYPSKKALARPEVKSFLDFYLANQAEITSQALFVPMTAAQLKASQDKLAAIAG